MSRRRTNSAFSGQDVLAALRSSIRILAWGMTALVALYLCSGITVVSPNEAGLILRFGKLLPGAHAPGLLFALPCPVDEVIKVPVKSVQEASLDLWASSNGTELQGTLNPVTQPYTLTGDVNIIRASFAVRYNVSDPDDYALAARDRDQLRDAVLYEAASHVLATMSVEDAMTVGKNYIGAEALRLAQERMDRLRLGIRLLAFETRSIDPPMAVSSAFQAVISAKVQSKTDIEEANAYAASLLPGAEADAYRMKQDAEAAAHQTVAKAEGETAAFASLAHEYGANPALVRARLQGEMMAAVMPRVKVAAVMPGGNLKVVMNPQVAKPLLLGSPR
jgi:membrane protease subunit HflK